MTQKCYIFLVVFFCTQIVIAQGFQYSEYKDKQHGFSFSLPQNWVITSENDEYSKLISVCKPKNTKEEEGSEDCYEGISFRIYCYDDSFAREPELLDRFEEINGVLYATFGRGDAEVIQIKRENPKSYYHNSVCGITCPDLGFLSAAGECEYYYFTNENTTIEISTNGRALDKEVSDQIIKSFVFN